MRRQVLYLFLLLLASSCQRDLEVESKQGWLSVEFLTDKSVETRAGEDEMRYALKIEKRDGTPVCSFEDCSVVSERILLPAGIYRLTASSGEDVETGFEVPLYQTQQEINLLGGENKQIALTCRQANVKVTVKYSEAVRKHFSAYTFTVDNGKGTLEFNGNEDRAGYLRVNEGALEWHLSLDNGQETYQLSKRITDVKARQHYHFAFDITEDGNESDGALTGGIVVDTALDVFNWECNIVLKEKTAKPTLSREDGGSFSEPYLVLAETRGANVICDVQAEAGISDFVVRHHSEELKKRGIPESFALTSISEEVRSAVNNAGILWNPSVLADAQQAVLDFSILANQLPLGDYTFYIGVYDTRFRLVEDSLRISVIPDIDHIADEANVMDVWAKFATIRGRWYTTVRPEGMALEYSTDRSRWTTATALSFNDAAKTFTASLTGLKPSTTYYFRTTSTGKGASETVREFTTEAAEQVPYLKFDTWYKSGKSYYLGEETATKLWDSGNEGANTMSEKNPTAPDYTNKVDLPGNEASGYLETKVVFGVMAAGNLYTGDFVEAIVNLSNPGAKLDFGIPYTCRPTTMKGYYKYQPEKITQTSRPNVNKGDLDSCYIYIALFADWTAPFRVNTQTATFVDLSTAIAYGEMKDSRRMEEFEEFTINLEYRDKTRKPKYILIVATASKYGDYFTGAEGSKLWIDEFELGFDPVE